MTKKGKKIRKMDEKKKTQSNDSDHVIIFYDFLTFVWNISLQVISLDYKIHAMFKKTGS